MVHKVRDKKTAPRRGLSLAKCIAELLQIQLPGLKPLQANLIAVIKTLKLPKALKTVAVKAKFLTQALDAVEVSRTPLRDMDTLRSAISSGLWLHERLFVEKPFFPTLAMGLLDFESLCCLCPEPDCSAQPHSISAVPNCRVFNHQVSLQ